MSPSDISAVNMPMMFPDAEICVSALKKKGYDEATARKMCEAMQKMTARRVGFVYQATFEPYEEQGKHLAKIHVIDLAPNKNDWQVTAPARAKALRTLLDAPLLGPSPDGEKGNVIGGGPGSPHEGLWSPVGRFVDFESNHATQGIAEITKDYAWEKIKGGEWNAVSPSVLAFVEHKEGDISVVDDFNFEHVLFVDKGAYPDAKVEGLCEGDVGSCNFYQALAAAAAQPLSSHSGAGLDRRVVGDVATSSSPTQTQVAEKKTGQKMEGGNRMKTTHESKEETNMDECNELQARVKELEPLQAQVTALKAENEALKVFKAEVERKQRMAKVQTIVDLKTHCGILEPKDHAQTFGELEKLSADALDAVEKELVAIQARLDSMPSGPKAKHTQEQAFNTIEDVREQMFGYRRDEHGEIIGGK
jgi:hypothetical protein